MQNTVTVNSMQSLLDLAIQTSGSVEAVFDLALESGLSITDILTVNTELNTVKAFSLEVLDYYKVNQIKPASDFTDSPVMALQGIDYWAVGIDFIVSKN